MDQSHRKLEIGKKKFHGLFFHQPTFSTFILRHAICAGQVTENIVHSARALKCNSEACSKFKVILTLS